MVIRFFWQTMDDKARFGTDAELESVDETAQLLRAAREEILRDWLDRVRDNRAVEAGQVLSDPILLDHVPQLFDAMIDRLEVNRTREEAEQLAAIHGFSRRITGYDVVETVIELLMFRRAIWSQLTACSAPVRGALAAMERIDGMVDRAVITSLKAFLDPSARMLVREAEGAEAAVDAVMAGRGNMDRTVTGRTI
jgi:hypothetical protein